MKTTKICVLGATVGISGALLMAPLTAAADPGPGLPWIPATPGIPSPGSYSLPYNVIYANPPYTTDSRGVRINNNSDAQATGTGMPGSRLGNGQNKTSLLSGANTRNGIQGGITPPTAPSMGIQVGAGNEGQLLEDPHGQPPGSAAGAEATVPTVLPMQPGTPAPVLESPDGQPPKPTGTAAAPSE